MNEKTPTKNRFYHHPYFKVFLKDIFLPLFLMGFLIPVMVVRITYIPSGSMTPTLMVGDKVLLSKIHYGPRTPQTLFQLPFFEKKYYKGIQLPSYRLPGISKLKRGKCFVFNCPYEVEHPVDTRTLFVKRCVGMPGDTIEIKKGEIYVNDVRFIFPKGVERQFAHNITLQEFKQSGKAIKFLISLGISEPLRTTKPDTYNIHITAKMAEELRHNKEVIKVERALLPSEKREKGYFEYGDRFALKLGGSIDSLRKIKIPNKGMEIKVNKKNLRIYGHVILHHEGYKDVKIDSEKGELTISGKKLESYTFKQSYYFAMGDNTGQSADSRFFGFVPDNHIVGKPIFIFISNKGSNFFIDVLTLNIRWNRLFKFVI